MQSKQINIYKILQLITCLMVFSHVSLATNKELLGWDRLIKDLDQIKVTDNHSFKNRKKDGRPKYLHQVSEEVYTLTFNRAGNYTLKIEPEEWFNVTKISDNVFAVKVINPTQMWDSHFDQPFDITWTITEIIDQQWTNQNR